MGDTSMSLFDAPPSDPDAQATVTDFMDFTEHLPSDLERSLALIAHLDAKYHDSEREVDRLTKLIKALPTLPAEDRPDFVTIREQISFHLSRMISSREQSFAEASRAAHSVTYHKGRIRLISSKLKALPTPPSREPTPIPTKSPDTKRSRSRRTDDVLRTVQSGETPEKVRKPISSSRRSRQLPVDEDSDEELESAPVRPTPKEKKPPKTPKPKTPVIPPISTSGALARLQEPPADAKIGSKHRPWLSLTEYEMAVLRKKMKKNAIWQPSEVMISRELEAAGRGWRNFRKAKADAEEAGEPFLDEADVENTYHPGRLLRKDQLLTPLAFENHENPNLSNRGMKLNEAKKLKRELLAREQAAAAALEADQAAQRMTDIANTFKHLIPGVSQAPAPLPTSVSSTPSKAPATSNGKSGDKTKSKKRKSDEMIEEPELPKDTSPLETPKPSKKQKTTKASAATSTSPDRAPAVDDAILSDTITTTIALAPEGASEVKSSKRTTRGSSAATDKEKLITTSSPIMPIRPPSRRRSLARSVEPSLKGTSPTFPNIQLLLMLTTELEATQLFPQVQTAASRRSKRPAPGPLSSNTEGSATISVGSRKAKPKTAAQKRKAAAAVAAVEQAGAELDETVRIDEDGVLEEIDPGEPRYCVCGDVSFGTMICCEAQDVSSLFFWSSLFVLVNFN